MSARLRWFTIVTAAETAGYLAPALTGIATTRAGWASEAQAGAIVGAGFVEGLALGFGQARALPIRIHRVRYALLTSLAAGLVWASVFGMMAATGQLSLPTAIAVCSIAGLVALASIGTAQWLELRHHVPGSWRWIAWTALAWLVALPASFAPGPFVDASTPFAIQVLAWGTGGFVMAFVMAAITWQGVRRVLARGVGLANDPRGK